MIFWHSAREKDMHIDLKRAHVSIRGGEGRRVGEEGREGRRGCEGGERNIDMWIGPSLCVSHLYVFPV